jgi:peptidyl-tRNA hydrolase
MAIVVRRDLNMPPGLLAAQVLHVGMLFVQDSWKVCRHELGEDRYSLEFEPGECEWIQQPYVAVLGVDTPEELAAVQKMGEDEKLPVRVWKDVIPSKVLEGRVLECVVGISIGPADSDRIRKATGTLPLF